MTQLGSSGTEYPLMFTALMLCLVFGQTTGPQFREPTPEATKPSARRPVARTPMSHLEARLHLQLAYLAVMGNSPNAKTLSRLLAQWALETGRGAGMWGYNFGGLKAAKGGLPLETRESYGLAQRPSTQRFRSYRTAVEGARDYVQTLARHFPKAFSALHHGSTTEFVQALAEESYFTGNPDQYRRAMVLLAVEYE